LLDNVANGVSLHCLKIVIGKMSNLSLRKLSYLYI